MKMQSHHRLQTKVIWRRFRIITTFTSWDIRTRDTRNFCLQTLRKNKICWKIVYFLRKIQTSQVNKAGNLRIKIEKFSENCFYMNPNIYSNFQICINVTLTRHLLSITDSLLVKKIVLPNQTILLLS